MLFNKNIFVASAFFKPYFWSWFRILVKFKVWSWICSLKLVLVLYCNICNVLCVCVQSSTVPKCVYWNWILKIVAWIHKMCMCIDILMSPSATKLSHLVNYSLNPEELCTLLQRAVFRPVPLWLGSKVLLHVGTIQQIHHSPDFLSSFNVLILPQ